MQSNNTIEHVSDTALWVAHYRALESERPDALFKDPYASVLVGERGRKIAESMQATSKYTAWSLVIRTYIIDNYILKLIEEGVDTIINLGAGLDTRPYRMNLPKSLRWIEVDYPHMIEHKENILEKYNPVCLLERVKLDLSDRNRRKEFFTTEATKSKKILLITEGVLPYLTEAQVTELADDLHSPPSFKYWIAEFFKKEVYPYLKDPKRLSQLKNSPFLFFPEDWLGLFKNSGWIPKKTTYLMEESIRLGRKFPGPWWIIFLRPFKNMQFIKKNLRFMAYVIYEKH